MIKFIRPNYSTEIVNNDRGIEKNTATDHKDAKNSLANIGNPHVKKYIFCLYISERNIGEMATELIHFMKKLEVGNWCQT